MEIVHGLTNNEHHRCTDCHVYTNIRNHFDVYAKSAAKNHLSYKVAKTMDMAEKIMSCVNFFVYRHETVYNKTHHRVVCSYYYSNKHKIIPW